MKPARPFQPAGLRQRAAALRHNVTRRVKPKPAPTMPTPGAVAAAVELDALSVPELVTLHDTASVLAEVCVAMTCRPCSIETAPDGTEVPNASGRLAHWQLGLCTALMDRCVDRLGDVAEAARRDGAAELLATAAEALRTRL
ncbi:hypothetical protein [Methylobacterium sp. Leaf361]|uniref:hypothetical protein n=1 Tax=Methylobacterium sp. Leaf361 TaxID=1736352 RepID=UPI000AC1CF94|nr:hypothetical protein [Methylobacterium sp. Leaf361]